MILVGFCYTAAHIANTHLHMSGFNFIDYVIVVISKTTYIVTVKVVYMLNYWNFY